MQTRRHIMAAAIVIGCQCATTAGGEVAPTPATRGYVKLIEQCEQYRRRTELAGWQQVKVLDFDGKPGTDQTPDWSLPDTSKATAELRHNDGHGVLYFHGVTGSSSLLKVGQVSGDFIVELRAKSISTSPCDMSIVCDGVSKEPGFQFGGHWNRDNFLWADRKTDKGVTRHVAVVVSNDKHIETGKWQTVRLMVNGSHELAWVDGQLLGTVRLGDDYEPQAQRTVYVYAYQSELLIDKVTFYRKSEQSADDEAAVWRDAFGDVTQAQVADQLRQLAELLDDDDWQTRQSAQMLLSRAGSIAKPVLEQVQQQGTAEQRWRAAQILRTDR